MAPGDGDDGPQQRRRWSDAERLKILEAVFAPGTVVADVARQFDVATSLIYKWRREQLAQSQPAFLPVMIVEPARRDSAHWVGGNSLSEPARGAFT